ncbi:putative choline and nitrogen mustard permease [Grosmannia clavigera kw1407]|uniref:Putative choline and nitrogen mustard permease n=1 Tax=Grosmannia clavigera (strain kw1407 / UAMH 11150) TaxID=655863 RepID=F0XB49_GROCL|nr:putative choline and nitrogen mustard permease [Grosmannia clavigera kw1407]EFX04889.1 putative choline and nitrogen mustard permease [Grosmannia clavigera kw1407]
MSSQLDEKTIDKQVGSLATTVVDVGTGDVQNTQVKKNFNLWSTLGISFSLTSTPITIGTYLSVSIGVGGSPVFFFGYILSVIMDLCVCASLAEMAAVLPHSSGQVHWTAVLAPRKYARGLSYTVGWLTAAGYFFWTAATFLITSQLIWALVQICHSAFETHLWHFYVLYLAIGLLSLLINGPLFSWYPYMLKGFVVYINAGALFVMVALLARAYPKESDKYVFVDIVNLTGWSSNGVVFFLGLLPGLTAVNGFDSAAHMAEEVPNPERAVPQVMMLSALASGLSGLPMILVYMFCITNTANLLAPVGGQPIAQLMVDSLNSRALTIICMIIFIVTFTCASFTMLTTWSRVWWSLSRENGTPFPSLMSRIEEKSQLPYNSIIFATVACALIGVLELGSNLALNAILGGAIICIFMSYAIPICCSLLGRRSAFAAKHYFNLGAAGTALNIISVTWIFFVFVWLCFPSYIPYTNATMNWAIVVFAGILALSGINWLAFSRKNFTVPVSFETGSEETSIEIGEK